MSEMTVRSTAMQAQQAGELSVEDLLEQMNKIQDLMKLAMVEGTHYGIIPGTDKPTLYKPGAEKLCLLFRLDPEYESSEVWHGDHLTVKTSCRLFHSPSGRRISSGEGMCSTKEAKYGKRQSKRACPVCGTESIIKGKAEYGGGWVCFKKTGGCGAKFSDGDERIEKQTVGVITNPDLADTYNTVLKMANKRALVAAVLNGTGASDIFAQDREDLARPAQVRKVTPALLDTLRGVVDELAEGAPDLWGEPVLLRNASQRFGVKIEALEDLTEEQAMTILEGATAWRSVNQHHPASPAADDAGPTDEPNEPAEVIDVDGTTYVVAETDVTAHPDEDDAIEFGPPQDENLFDPQA